MCDTMADQWDQVHGRLLHSPNSFLFRRAKDNRIDLLTLHALVLHKTTLHEPFKFFSRHRISENRDAWKRSWLGLHALQRTKKV